MAFISYIYRLKLDTDLSSLLQAFKKCGSSALFAPQQHTMVHWGLDVHVVDRHNSSMLQLHGHVLQRGQAERHGACAHRVLIVCALKQRNRQLKHPADNEQLVAGDFSRNALKKSIHSDFSLLFVAL